MILLKPKSTVHTTYYTVSQKMPHSPLTRFTNVNVHQWFKYAQASPDIYSYIHTYGKLSFDKIL